MGRFLDTLRAIGGAFSGGEVITAPRNAVDPTTLPATQNPTPFGTGDNGVRTNVAWMTLPSLQAMKPRERLESVRTSRYLNNRLGLAKALNENSVLFSIGEGVFAYAATGDPEFDASADRFLDALFEDTNVDVTREQNFYDLQQVAALAMLVDGDCGTAKILRRDANGAIVGEPQLQLFTTDQIGNDGTEGYDSRWREGVLRDDVGAALRYRVLKEYVPGVSQRRSFDYAARDFLLVLDRKRIGLGRGIPWSHHGHDNGMAIMDLDALEKAAAYVNSFFAAWIETPTGETPEALEEVIMQRLHSQTTEQDVSGTLTTQTEQVTRRFMNLFGGGAIPVFKQGESMKTWKSDRPGPVQTGYMTWLAQQYAIGYKIPPSMVWLIAGGTGPENRVSLTQANWFFRSLMRLVVSRFAKPVRDWCLLYGLLAGKINGGKLPKNGADYRLARWRGPKDMTIDERYFYKTWLDRLKDGKGTEEEFYALLGQDADQQARKRIEEIRDRMEWCKAAGVPWEYYVASMPGQNIAAPVDPALMEAMQTTANER